MTVKVAGVWERGYIAPLNEYDLWQFPLRDFGVDEFIMAPITGISGRVTEVPTIASALEQNPNLTPVCLDECGEQPLSEFEHPENALYLFGRVGYSIMRVMPDIISVRVDTPQNSGLLWPHQVAVLALYDREMKRGRNDS